MKLAAERLGCYWQYRKDIKITLLCRIAAEEITEGRNKLKALCTSYEITRISWAENVARTGG